MLGNAIKKMIIPGFPMFILTLIAGMIGMLQLMVGAAIKQNTKIGQVSCVAVNYKIGTENRIHAELTCDGKEGFHGNAETTLLFIQKPGPHTCTVFESKKAQCE